MALRKSDEAIRPIPAAGDPPKLLDVRFVRQDRNNWCWAACCDMALSQRKRPEVRQCDVAHLYLEGDCCGTDPCDSECAITDVEKVFEDSGLPGTTFLETFLLESVLKGQLEDQGGNTVAVGLKGSPNHMVLVVGVAGALFRVFDPAFGEGYWKYDEIKAGLLRQRTWAWTWKDLR